MIYLTVKAFNKTGIDDVFMLPVGTELEEKNGFICYNNKRICFKTSQNAYDYFSRNDDGQGTQRYNLINQVKNKIAEYVADYNEDVAAIQNGDLTEEQKAEQLALVVDKSVAAYDAIRQDSNTSNVLKENDNIFNYNFYNANILVLNHILDLVGAADEGED